MFLKAINWLSNVGGLLLTLLTNWSAVVGIAAAMGGAAGAWWEWGTQYGYTPIFLVGLGAAVLAIWTVNGVTWWRRQRRPSRSMLAFDYSYSLALEAVQPALDLGNEENTFELRLIVKNTSQRPIKMAPEKIEYKIEDRYVEAVPRGSLLGAGMAITIIPNRGFSGEAWRSFKERTSGSITFSILYGHPDYPFSRRAVKRLHLDVFKKDEGKDALVNWLIQTELDEEATK